MCVMGVDVGYDPNFSDAANKQGVLYSWLNRFLCSNETGFGHDSNGYNEMATYQSMYALQSKQFWKAPAFRPSHNTKHLR